MDGTTTVETLSPLIISRLAAVLDLDARDVLEQGTVPPLWHWAFFTDVAKHADLGDDGHLDRAKHGERPEDVAAFPRRMFAGGRLQVDTPLHIGASAQCHSEVSQVTVKEGSQGTLRFVTVRDQISDDRGGRIAEERDLVYLSSRSRSTVRIGAPLEAPTAPWSGAFSPDPVLLFRFSAVTFNSHRIHYDRAYATEVEGYPDLVVHGPLLAMRLCELGRRNAEGGVAEFSFRARQPVFLGEEVALRGWPEGRSAELAAYSRGTGPAVTALLRAAG